MRYIVLALSVVLVLSACTKLAVPGSREDQLRAGKWKLSAASVTFRLPNPDTLVNKDTTEDLLRSDKDHPSIMPDYMKDDHLEFYENFKGGYFLGSNKVSGSDPDQIPFDWQMTNQGTKMTIYNTGAGNVFQTDDVNGTLPTFSASSFVIKYNIFIPDFFYAQKRDSLKYTMTFVKF